MFKQFFVEVFIFAALITATVFSLYSDGKTIGFVSYALLFLVLWISITFFKRMRIYFAMLKFRMKNGYWCDDPVEVMADMNSKEIVKQLKMGAQIDTENPSKLFLKQILKGLVTLAFSITLFILMHNSDDKFLQVFSYIFIIAAIFSTFSLVMSIYLLILISVGSKPKK